VTCALGCSVCVCVCVCVWVNVCGVVCRTNMSRHSGPHVAKLTVDLVLSASAAVCLLYAPCGVEGFWPQVCWRA
jgi:hypothetical protein